MNGTRSNPTTKLLDLAASSLISAKSLVGVMYGEHVPLMQSRMVGATARYLLSASPSFVWVVV